VAVTSPLYFDHNATTPVLPEVVEAMLPFLTTHFGNPSSAHEYGRVAKEALEHARAQVAALVNAPVRAVIFTSGGTEATALALRGVLSRAQARGLVTSTVATELERQGVAVRRVGVDEHGVLRTMALEHALTAPTGWSPSSTRTTRPACCPGNSPRWRTARTLDSISTRRSRQARCRST
jgi:cysteine desulfurase